MEKITFDKLFIEAGRRGVIPGVASIIKNILKVDCVNNHTKVDRQILEQLIEKNFQMRSEFQIHNNAYPEYIAKRFNIDLTKEIYQSYLKPEYFKDYLKDRATNIVKIKEAIKQEEQEEDQVWKDIENECLECEIGDLENNFDNVEMMEVYKYFYDKLVVPKYLTEQDLYDYIKLAFHKLEIPTVKFKFKDFPVKEKIHKPFHQYYKNKAGRPKGKQKEYAKLLGEYFEGYKTESVSTNWTHY